MLKQDIWVFALEVNLSFVHFVDCLLYYLSGFHNFLDFFKHLILIQWKTRLFLFIIFFICFNLQKTNYVIIFLDLH